MQCPFQKARLYSRQWQAEARYAERLRYKVRSREFGDIGMIEYAGLH